MPLLYIFAIANNYLIHLMTKKQVLKNRITLIY